MPEFLPEGKTCISIKTRGFPGLEKTANEYEFEINCRAISFDLTIPGAYDGPDNCEPYFKEQEKWLDNLAENGIKRTWDCRWQIENETALRRFLQSLEPFRIETKYY